MIRRKVKGQVETFETIEDAVRDAFEFGSFEAICNFREEYCIPLPCLTPEDGGEACGGCEACLEPIEDMLQRTSVNYSPVARKKFYTQFFKVAFDDAHAFYEG